MENDQKLIYEIIALAGIALVTINQVFAFIMRMVKDWWDERKDRRNGGGMKRALYDLRDSMRKLTASMPPYPVCHYDLKHFDRIKRVQADVEEIKASQASHQRLMDKGAFACRLTESHLRALDRLGD